MARNVSMAALSLAPTVGVSAADRYNFARFLDVVNDACDECGIPIPDAHQFMRRFNELVAATQHTTRDLETGSHPDADPVPVGDTPPLVHRPTPRPR